MTGKTVLEALHDKYGGTDSGVCDIYLPASAPGKTGRFKPFPVLSYLFQRHKIAKMLKQANPCLVGIYWKALTDEHQYVIYHIM